MIYASVADFRAGSRRRVPRFLSEYIEGGSYAETTLRANVDDLAAVSLRQRVLRDVSKLDLSTTLFGQDMAMPLVLAPVGFAGLNARRGECQAVRAANAANVPFTLSTVSACAIEEVATAASAPFWFQLYVLKDRSVMRNLIARARAAGCTALVFTVDLPTAGARYRDFKTGMSGMPGWRGAMYRNWQAVQRPGWAWDVGINGRPLSLGNLETALGRNLGVEGFAAWIGANFDPSINWDDLAFIRSEWDGTLILKGILDVEDARKAADFGADGIVVSNHGGRQLDGALSSARALPEIARAVGDRVTVLADGGVRSGLDVVRMLALGAKGVMIGRAWVWALGAAGQAGVARMLEIFEAEMRVAMTLTGVTSIREIDQTILAGEPKS